MSAPLSYTRLQNVRLEEDGATAEWAIGDYVPGGGAETGEFMLAITPFGVGLRAFPDGREVLKRFLETPVMAELDLGNVGEQYVEQCLAEHLEHAPSR